MTYAGGASIHTSCFADGISSKKVPSGASCVHMAAKHAPVSAERLPENCIAGPRLQQAFAVVMLTVAAGLAVYVLERL